MEKESRVASWGARTIMTPFLLLVADAGTGDKPDLARFGIAVEAFAGLDVDDAGNVMCSTWHKAATEGTGTSARRTSLGSERISVVTSSPRSAGTSQSKPSARSRGRTLSGTWTVTPSCSLPGSKR